MTRIVGVLQGDLLAAILRRPEFSFADDVGAIVCTGERHGIGLPASHLCPAVDDVFARCRVGAAEADGGLSVVGEDLIGVGNHHPVHAQRFAVSRFVLEVVEQPFFGQQPRDEIEVAFFVLRDDAAARVHRGIPQ